MMNIDPASLQYQIEHHLPGEKTHFEMSPRNRKFYPDPKGDFKKAGVLALLYPIENEWQLLFIKRTSRDLRDKHAGQISFPGGGLELEDKDMEDCALRETFEEVGVDPKLITVIGALTQIFVFVSNYMIYPYLAFAEKRPEFTIQESEVDHIIEVPLSHFELESTNRIIDYTVRGFEIKDMPIYDIQGDILWGATAMMTNEILHLIKNSQPDTA